MKPFFLKIILVIIIVCMFILYEILYIDFGVGKIMYVLQYIQTITFHLKMKEMNTRANNQPFLKNINPTSSPLNQPRLSHQASLSSSTTGSKILGTNMDEPNTSGSVRGNTPGNSSNQYSSHSPYSPYGQSGNTSPYNQTGKSPYSPLSPKTDEVKKKIPTFLEQKNSVSTGMKGSLFMNDGDTSSPLQKQYSRGDPSSYNAYKSSN